MQDLKTLLVEDENLDLVLQEAALEYLVLEKRDLYSFCPTADCPTVYTILTEDKSERNRLFECPKCSVMICRKCKAIDHIGMDCDYFQLYNKNEDFPVLKWIALNSENRKMCPKCRSGIEKNGGWNHMTCINCNAHICWLCMKVFSTGNEVYLHQPLCMHFSQNNQ